MFTSINGLSSNLFSRMMVFMGACTTCIFLARVIPGAEGDEGKEGQYFVCSNHFVDGKLIKNTLHPTPFLTKMENKHQATAHATSVMQGVYL